MDVTLHQDHMIRWTNWIVFERNSGPCGLSRAINRYCGIFDELGIKEQAPGQPESLDDLVSFFFLRLGRT